MHPNGREKNLHKNREHTYYSTIRKYYKVFAKHTTNKINCLTEQRDSSACLSFFLCAWFQFFYVIVLICAVNYKVALCNIQNICCLSFSSPVFHFYHSFILSFFPSSFLPFSLCLVFSFIIIPPLCTYFVQFHCVKVSSVVVANCKKLNNTSLWNPRLFLNFFLHFFLLLYFFVHKYVHIQIKNTMKLLALW